MKRKTLYYTFLLTYVLVFICSFLVIDLWTSKTTQETLVSKKAKELYDTANVLCDSIVSAKYDDIAANKELQTRINNLSLSSNTKIQLINMDGSILYDTQSDIPNEISDFDITDFGSKYYMVGRFYDTFSADTLSVVVPVTRDFSTKGYILLHYNMSQINDLHLSIMNTTYLTFFFVFLFTLLILLIFTITVFKPLQEISAAAREYAKGNFTYEGLSEFKEDTEIGRLGVSLNFMAHELNTMESDERKFIANISHDFRSPLTSIKGYVEAIKDGTIPIEAQEKYLDIVLFETERLTKLTENLLTLNKWDNRGNHLDYSDFNVYTLIKQNLTALEGKCEKKKITFDLISGSKYYMAYADKGKIEQVIYNLIDNAIKFSNNNSVITISLVSKGEKLFISIKDTGIGIPKDSLSKIWTRFYKTDLSRGKDKTGSGLGLSITKEIVQAHKENINVISTEGVGTEFIFTLQKSKKSISQS